MFRNGLKCLINYSINVIDGWVKLTRRDKIKMFFNH